MIIKQFHKDYWFVRFIGIGLVLSIEHNKAFYFGKSQGWHFDICLRKNTIY